MTKKPKFYYVGRSAIAGRFVSVAKAKRYPKTHIIVRLLRKK